MALPASGQISMDNMNTDRGIASGTQINLATAGTAYSVSYNTSGTNDLQFSEFYGLSITPVYTSYSSSLSTGAEAGCYAGDFYTDFTITLLDQFGNPISLGYDVDFGIKFLLNDVQDVGGGYYPDTITNVRIFAGFPTGYRRFYDKRYLNCNFSSLCDGSCYEESTGMYIFEGPITVTTTTTTTTTTAAPIYSGLILCGETNVDYYYTGTISSGDHLYSGAGNCYVSTGTIGSIFGKVEIFGTINGCSC
jgi:hypothetical protein